MSHAMVPFEAPQLPAHIAAMEGVSADDLTAGAGGGFPVISIKGKVFHITRGDDRQLVTRPEAPDEPASSIEVVILRANPALSKTYYAKTYQEGDDAKPTCYSNDGIAPEPDAVEPQAAKCATCPHNQWGSRVSENQTKAKACADVRRLAVAPIGQLNDPMLLRVPAASLKTLREYGDLLKKRGVIYPAVSTKIGFDFQVAHPALTFKPVAFLDEEQVATVQEMMRSDQVAQILAMRDGAGVVKQAALAPAAAIPAPKPAPIPQAVLPQVQAAPQPQQVAPKPAPKPAAKKTTAGSAFASAPAVAPQAAPVQKGKVIEVNSGDLEADLDKVLAAAGFDDK